MKKVLLTCPLSHKLFDVTLGHDNMRNFAYQHEEIKKSVDIEILKLDISESLEDQVKKIAHLKPDMVGMSTFIWNLYDNLYIAGEIKRMMPEVVIILGGPQISDPEWNILEYTDNIDGVVRGEGEVTFSLILKSWLKNGHVYDRTIPNYEFKENGQIIVNPDGPPIENLDIIPKRFENFRAEPGGHYCIETIRGCRNRCSYCFEGPKRIRKHSLEYVFSELENIYKAGIKNLQILDSSFTYDKKRFKEISSVLKKYGIRYSCCANIDELTPEIMDILIDTGLKDLDLGIQSTNPEALRLMNRKDNTSLFENYAKTMIQKVKGSDIRVSIDIIAGLPGDNLKTFCQSMDFAYNLRPFQVGAYPFQLLPGTEYFKRRDEFGIKFIPFTNVNKHANDRYDFQKYGLVTETFSFKKDEMITAHHICSFNTLIVRSRLVELMYELLNETGHNFSDLFFFADSILPSDFYSHFDDLDNRESAVYLWNCFCDVLYEYGKKYGCSKIAEKIKKIA